MNKQNLWFVTLFSLVLVLSVYYITMPNELLLTNNSNQNINEVNKEEIDDNIDVKIEECSSVIAYNENLEEKRNKKISNLESVMLDNKNTAEDKNIAFEQIKYLKDLTGKEELLEKKIKNNLKIESFIEIDNSSIKVVAAKKDHDIKLANKIMEEIQKEFKNKMYITVKFES